MTERCWFTYQLSLRWVCNGMQILSPLSCLPCKELCLGKPPHVFSASNKIVSSIRCLFGEFERSGSQGRSFGRGSLHKCNTAFRQTRLRRLWACSKHAMYLYFTLYLRGVQLRVGVISHGTGFGVIVGTLWIQVVKVLCPVKWVGVMFHLEIIHEWKIGYIVEVVFACLRVYEGSAQ